MSVRKILREPLLHFILIGLGLFMLYGRVSPGDSGSRQIVVSQRHVDDMIRQFQSTWNRPPSAAELTGLVDTYVRDEIVYREGLALGLDRDDTVIKRRVRQKYDLIAEEEVWSVPTDADLLVYLNEHRAKFVRPAVVSFNQVYFDPGITSPEGVTVAKSRLEKGASPATLGQPSMLPRRVSSTSLDLVARDYGEGFASQVATAPVGKWVGPLVSGIGVHLVRVDARYEPELPPLDQVRTEVTREWESDKRIRSRDTDYRKLRAEYDVVVQAKLPSAARP